MDVQNLVEIDLVITNLRLRSMAWFVYIVC